MEALERKIGLLKKEIEQRQNIIGLIEKAEDELSELELEAEKIQERIDAHKQVLNESGNKQVYIDEIETLESIIDELDFVKPVENDIDLVSDDEKVDENKDEIVEE